MNYREQKENIQDESIRSRHGQIFRQSGNLFIVRQTSKVIPRQFIGSSRSGITGFSNDSALRMRTYLRECIAEYRQMVTLTYPCGYPSNGKHTKEHLRRFNQEVMREHSRNGPVGNYDGKERLSIFWFLEFQERGAPHYHMFGTWFPSKEWVAKTWYRIVDSEDIRHLHAGTRTEFLRTGRGGTISYASKYANKLKQKVPPKDFENVGRFWGICGGRAVVSASTFVGSDLASFNRTYGAIKSMFYELNRLIEDGNAKVLLRKEGVLVVTILNKFAEKKMFNQVARLTAVSGVQRDLFSDAELDDSNEKLPDTNRFEVETSVLGEYPFEQLQGNSEKSNLLELKPCL
jgi:hypothetical protein